MGFVYYLKSLPYYRWLIVFITLVLNAWLELVFVETISEIIEGRVGSLSNITMSLVVLRYPVAMIGVFVFSKHNADLVNQVAQRFTNKFLNPAFRMSQDEFIRFSLTEVEHIVNTVFAPLLLLFLEVVIVFFGINEVVTTLSPVFQDRPLILFGFSVIVLIISLFFINAMRALGKTRQVVQKKRFRAVSQAFESRWLLNSKETLYKSQNNQINIAFNKFARVTRNSQAMQQMPRYVFEGAFMSVLGLLLLILQIPLTSLAFVLIIGSRLLPSFMKVLTSLQTVMYGLKALSEFKEKTINFSQDKESLFEPNIELHGLVSSVSKGIIQVTGESGSGKSTLLKELFLNKEYTTVLLPQPISLPDFEYSNLLNEVANCEDKKLKNYLTSLLPRDLNNKVDWEVLSGGEKTRIGLIQVCLSPCSILILDEPDTGLDESNATIVKQLVEFMSESRLIIIVSHSMIFHKAIKLCL